MFHNQIISVILLLENSLTKAVIFNVASQASFDVCTPAIGSPVIILPCTQGDQQSVTAFLV